MAFPGFGNLGTGWNGQSYQMGFGHANTSDLLYYNQGAIANQIYADSQAIWDREDSAYQRMVADMKKAGLNPWTGISSGGSPTSSTNPSMDSLSSLLGILNAMNSNEKTASNSSYKLANILVDFLTLGISAMFR